MLSMLRVIKGADEFVNPEAFIAIIRTLVLAVGVDMAWARMRAGRAPSGHRHSWVTHHG